MNDATSVRRRRHAVDLGRGAGAQRSRATSRRWCEELARALAAHAPFEIIYVNDGSSDGTEAELRALMRERPYLRQIKHEVSCGQSAAVRTGVAAARAAIVADARWRWPERSGLSSDLIGGA